MNRPFLGRLLCLLSLLTLHSGISPAQPKTVAERLGYPADSKLLIILADDVGVYHAANEASFTALNQGAVTSETVMQTSPWLTEVAAYAKQHPDISLGVHLTLSSEHNTYRWSTVAPRDQAPSLLDPTGYLFLHGSDTVSHAKTAEIERELRAQIDRALQFGFKPDFVDSHQRALFSNEELFRIYMKVAHDYKLPFLIGRDRSTGGRFVPLVSDKDLVVDSVTVIPSTTPGGGLAGLLQPGGKGPQAGAASVLRSSGVRRRGSRVDFSGSHRLRPSLAPARFPCHDESGVQEGSVGESYCSG